MLERVMPSTQSTSRAQRSPRRGALARFALFAAGIALLVVFVARVGVGDVAAELRRAGTKGLWLFVPYAAGTTLGAFPFGSLLPRAVRPSPFALVKSRFAASSANSLLPFFGMAGEPSRLLWLPKEAGARGLAAIALDRLLYNAANGLLLVTGALVAAFASTLPTYLVAIALVLGVLTFAATPLGFFALAKLGVGSRAHRLALRFLGQRERDTAFGQRVDAALVELLRGPRRPLWTGAALHLLGRSLLALEIPVGLWALGADYDFPRALVLAVVPIALSFVFSSIPGQLGVQEGAQTLVASSLGLEPTVVLSLVLLQRFRQLAFAALLPVLLYGASKRSSAR